MKTPVQYKTLSLGLLIFAFACGGGGSNATEKTVVVDKTLLTSDFPQMSPSLLEEAAQAYTEVLQAQQGAGVLQPEVPCEICSQGNSFLCHGFALRDLMVNNLGLKEKLKPAIFALLQLNPYAPGEVMISDQQNFNLEDYRFLKLANEGGQLATENSLPFDPDLFVKYESLLRGEAYNSKYYTRHAVKPRVIEGESWDDEKKVPARSIILDRLQSTLVGQTESVTVPRFRYLRSAISTRNLVSEMKILAERLAKGKSQVVSVCGEYITGLSKKLLNEKNARSAALNVEDFAGECGTHAVLLTQTRLDEQGQAYITFKNSWGTDLSDNGSQELTIKQFISILASASNDKFDNRIVSSRTELVPAVDAQPQHEISNVDGWKILAATADGVIPVGKVRWENIFTKDYIDCEMKEKEATNCSGRLTWRSTREYKKFYRHQGEIKIKDLTMWGFGEWFQEGQGKMLLWGNVIKEGTFKNDIMVQGIYRQYFSAGRSSQVNIEEEGTFDPESEDFLKGVRRTYNRAGTLVKTEQVGGSSRVTITF